jgi:ankyrin repeat protein
MRLLLGREDIQANFKYSDGRTPLPAARAGRKAIVQLMLEKGEVNSIDKQGRTLLLWAAFEGHNEVAQLLLDREDIKVNSKDNGGRIPLSWTASNGHTAVVKLLKEKVYVILDGRIKIIDPLCLSICVF